MARVTVEDCLEKINNRFELVRIAAKRAHQLNAGTHSSLLDANGDKPAIIALREIANGVVDAGILKLNTKSHFGTTNLDEVQAELNQTALDNQEDSLSEVDEDKA